MDDHSPSDAVRGRSRGVVVGAVFALGWALFGASGFDSPLRYVLVAVAIAATVMLVRASRWMRIAAQGLPPATSAQSLATRRRWRWFWINFLGEIILLNIAINLLSAPALQVYWVPAISAVVGLHFWPMAQFFRARSYWWIGGAMLAGAALTALLIARTPGLAFELAHAEALANALILWCGMAAGVRAAMGLARRTTGAVSAARADGRTA